VIKLETNRLVIRNFVPDDWRGLQEVAIQYQASEWAKYEDPWPTGTDEVKGMTQFFTSGDDYLAVSLKDTGKLIGLIAIERRKEQEERVHNLGYVFHPGYSGQGYATEGCRAMMAYLFEQMGIDAIVTGTRPENIPSVRLLERLGIKPIGNGEYRMSKEEWLSKQ
jgi:ribosomal-protein-alanine N-acetyltransferase